MRASFLLAAALAGFAALAALAPGARAQTAASVDAARRDAAATFALGRAASLGLLRGECGRLLGGDRGAESVARGWWDRNREAVVAALVWADRSAQATSQGDAAAARRAAGAVAASMAAAAQETAATYFGGGRPTPAQCTAALLPWQMNRMELQAPGGDAPGTATTGEVLAGVRAEPGYAVPPHLRTGFDTLVRPNPLASLQAAEAARERGDADTVRAIFTELANGGDGAAARVLGAMHLRGEGAARDDRQAWRWFYTAWSLGDGEALNAMGTMLREGRAGRPAPEPQLALAAFHLAARMPGSPDTQARAARSAQQLQAGVSALDRQALACMRLAELNGQFGERVPAGERADPARLLQPDRRLGELAPALGEGLPACG